MERESTAARDLLDRAPDFDVEMRRMLLRARMDLDRSGARERLRWVRDQARARGQYLDALSAEAESAALGELSADEIAPWQDQARQRGLRALPRPQ